MRTDEMWQLVLGSQAAIIDTAKTHLDNCAEAGLSDSQAAETLRQMRSAHRASLGRAPLHVLEQFAADPRFT